MSKKAIKKLNDKHPNYSLNAELAGENKTAGTFIVKAFLQIFDPKYEAGKQPTILKSVNSYGTGTSLELAQENAIEKAVDSAGL